MPKPETVFLALGLVGVGAALFYPGAAVIAGVALVGLYNQIRGMRRTA